MFEFLEPFTRIIVTGPQRSGTTLVARAIAQDLGRQYIDEQAFTATNVDKWRSVVRTNNNFVMQAPGMCRFVHEFGHWDEVAVVLVRRNIDDIIASQERVGWRWEDYELKNYGKASGPISQVKYDYWDNYQTYRIKNNFEVRYEDMVNHPLWVDKADRRGWHVRQWRNND